MSAPRGVGRFFDGRTAAAMPADIHVEAEALVIASDYRAPPARWPLQSLRVTDRRPDGSAVLAAHGEEGRLVVDAALLAALAIPDESGRAGPRLSAAQLRRYALVAAALAAALALLWLGWPPLADRLALAVPASFAESLGGQVTESLVSGKRLCTQPAGTAALQRLTDRLAAQLTLPHPVRVQVVDDPLVNAFAAPGGYIVLFRGLIAGAGSPEEVAGVLAHELGHVAASHPLRLLMRYSGLSLAAMLIWGDLNMTTIASLLATFSYSRGFENEADARAIEILQRAGIDSRGLSHFFARVDAGRIENALRYISTHPTSLDRRAAIEALARPGAPALTPGEWTALRGICQNS